MVFNYVCILIATSVKFDQSAYSVNERNEKVQIVLVLSNPSSTIITVEVLSTDGSATGKHKYIDGKTSWKIFVWNYFIEMFKRIIFVAYQYP